MASICEVGNTFCEIAIEHIVPIVGCFPLMYIILSPIPAVRQMEREKSVGGFNIVIFPAMLCVALSFLLYGLVLKNYYIYIPNFISFLSSLYFCVSSIRFASLEQQNRMIVSLVVGLGFVLTVAMVAIITFAAQPNVTLTILGGMSCFVIISLNLTPFTTLPLLIKKKDASSIFKPLAYGMILTGLLWGTYGALLGDPFILTSNISSILSGSIQLILALVYPGKKVENVVKEKGYEKKEEEVVLNEIKVVDTTVLASPALTVPEVSMYKKDHTMLM